MIETVLHSHYMHGYKYEVSVSVVFRNDLKIRTLEYQSMIFFYFAMQFYFVFCFLNSIVEFFIRSQGEGRGLEAHYISFHTAFATFYRNALEESFHRGNVWIQ